MRTGRRAFPVDKVLFLAASLPVFVILRALAPDPPSKAPDIVIADFEGDGYGEWQVSGEAFGKGPAKGALPNQMKVGGYLGRGLVNSFWGGDGSTGALTSPQFKIARKYVHFLIGGGKHPGETCINLIVDGKVERSATGPNSEFLRWSTWDVKSLEGQTAVIQIVDEHTGQWGHINIDQIYQSNEKPLVVDDRDGALTEAMRSVEKAAEKARKDPTRPVYHFRAPANWTNDPNGPIHYKGYYHLFYQHNPYGDRWDHMHWGHARTKDLVKWEHLPIALWPSKALGEEHCFSGCAAINGQGEPMIFYTSIGHDEPECWAAIPEDDDLIRWKKHPSNPLLKESSAGLKLYEWRDPFIFRHDGQVFLVHGGNLNAGKGGQAAVSLYRAEDEKLTRWSFLGILFQHPDPKVSNIECPNFFPLCGRWVLIVSPHRECDYFVGAFDTQGWKFQAEHQGKADHGSDYYAPNNLLDPQGRRILWGWVKGFKDGLGWNGCMTLPRVLTLGRDGKLIQEPAPELRALRGRRQVEPRRRLNDAFHVLQSQGDVLEIQAELESGGAKVLGLKVRRSSDGRKAITIAYDGNAVDVAGIRVPFKVPLEDGALKLHVFLDKSVLEVYVNDGKECITKVIYPGEEDLGIEVFAQGGGASIKSLDVWEMRSIWD